MEIISNTQAGPTPQWAPGPAHAPPGGPRRPPRACLVCPGVRWGSWNWGTPHARPALKRERSRSYLRDVDTRKRLRYRKAPESDLGSGCSQATLHRVLGPRSPTVYFFFAVARNKINSDSTILLSLGQWPLPPSCHYGGELITLLAAERSGASQQQGVNPQSRGRSAAAATAPKEE